MMKRKTYQPKDKMNGPLLTHMRDVAFGNKTCVAIHQTMERAERMRNDQGMLDAAQAKRDRKAAKARKANAQAL
ncbi:hypothetical protein [Propionivibrio sp.]|uniref:hypothetical protein n=1 Tax=Propionivibrio sp. TaxID=2212460 RepID=UPI003BEFE8E7